MDFLQDFLKAMSDAGCAPRNAGDILANDKRIRFQLADDKPGRRNGECQVKIDGDFAVGWFKNYREGVVHKWHSRAPRKYSAEEKKAFRERIEAERARKDAELVHARQAAAERAAGIWKRAERTGSTPYLTRKRSDLHSARLRSDLVVIPMYSGKRLVSLQFIAPDGSKRFLRDGQKEGAWFPIAEKDDDKALMLICEGFATGDSLRRATGLPVIVAFDAGNLKPVALAMREKYPDTRFVFCADNDRFTARPDGSPWNPGIEKAREAAAAIGGATVVWPEFPDETAKHTDFNDAYLNLGVEYVKERVMSALHRADIGDPPGQVHPYSDDAQLAGRDFVDQIVPLEAYVDEETRHAVSMYRPKRGSDDENWRERLYTKDDGGIHPRSLNNARLFIEHHETLSNLFCYDEFAHEKIVYQCPPWQDVEKFKPRPLNDDDITQLTVELERCGIIQPFGIVSKIVNAVVKNNGRNPAVEYFNSLQWDGLKRLDRWLTLYCGAEFDDQEYVSAVGRKWLTAAVARVFEPGCKFDHMLILEGEQDSGKSETFKQLATIHGKRYFDDTIKVSDLGDSRIVPKMQGVLIIEIAELSGFRKKDSSEFKQAITTTQDRIIRKYENEATVYPRQFVFAGTINPESGYLIDPTGNRRFWPVKIGKSIDIEGIKRDREQLWAEAVQAYRAGEELFLEARLKEKARSAQRDRNNIHPWQPDIEKLVGDSERITVDEIWTALGVSDRTKRTRQASDDVTKIMTGLGYESSRRRFNGQLEYCWVRKERDEDLPLEAAA